jgi:hypothetical protein
VAFVCGSDRLEAGPGAFVYGPRDTANGFKHRRSRRIAFHEPNADHADGMPRYLHRSS